jgi:uncharacterized protein YoaH (UPF0181 family)
LVKANLLGAQLAAEEAKNHIFNATPDERAKAIEFALKTGGPALEQKARDAYAAYDAGDLLRANILGAKVGAEEMFDLATGHKDDQSSDLNGQAAQALALIEKLPPEQQASVLAAPGAKEGLTDSGQGEAVERIERGMAQGQTRAAKDDQSSDLNGQAAQILALIEKLTPEQQVSVLATPGAVQGLAHKEQGEAVEKLRRDVAQWRTRMAKKDQSSDLER